MHLILRNDVLITARPPSSLWPKALTQRLFYYQKTAFQKKIRKNKNETVKEFFVLRNKLFFLLSIYKNLVLLVFDFMLWTLLLYQFLLPITFLRVMLYFLLFRFLVMKEKFFFHSQQQHSKSTLYNYTHMELYLFSLRIISSWKLQLWKESWACRNTKGIEKFLAGIPISP